MHACALNSMEHYMQNQTGLTFDPHDIKILIALYRKVNVQYNCNKVSYSTTIAGPACTNYTTG